MKFSAAKSSLIAAFAVVKPAIAKRAIVGELIAPGESTVRESTDAFKCVYISGPTSPHEVRLIAYDGELLISHYCHDVKIDESGEALLPVKLFELLAAERADILVTIETDEGGCRVTLGERELLFSTPSVLEAIKLLPAFPTMKTRAELPADFRARVASVLPNVSRDETRPQLCGVNISQDHKSLSIVATDGWTGRAVQSAPNLSPHFSAILPARVCKLLASAWCKSAGAASLFMDRETCAAWLRWENTNLFFHCVSGRFPNLGAVVPESCAHRLTVRRGILEPILKCLSVCASDELGYMVLSLSESACRAEVDNIFTGDYGLEPLPCVYSGPPLEIALSLELTRRVLHAQASDLIEFSFSGQKSACIVRAKHAAESGVPARPESSEYSLLMPVDRGNRGPSAVERFDPFALADDPLEF